MKKINVEFFEDIAAEVKRLGAAMAAINESKLKEEAIIVLLQKSTGENQSTIKRVLYGLQTIGKYVK